MIEWQIHKCSLMHIQCTYTNARTHTLNHVYLCLCVKGWGEGDVFARLYVRKVVLVYFQHMCQCPKSEVWNHHWWFKISIPPFCPLSLPIFIIMKYMYFKALPFRSLAVFTRAHIRNCNDELWLRYLNLDESIYGKKHPNPQQIATKGFSTVFGSIRYQE